MIAVHVGHQSPFRRGLADMMEATENRREAYDRLLGVVAPYDRQTALPMIFGDRPVGRLKAPTFPQSRVKVGLEIITTEVILTALDLEQSRCERRFDRSPTIYRELLKQIEQARAGERRIKAELLAQRRFGDG